MKKSELIPYLDHFLEAKKFTDSSKNGLQVDSAQTEIHKIGYAVDANSFIFERAILEKVDFLIVHHGLFWGQESPITGLLHERIAKLIKHDIALYAMHLPLDAHPTIGNNIGIAQSFINFCGIAEPSIEKFGEYHGETIGYGVRFSEAITPEMIREFSDAIGFEFRFFNFGSHQTFSSMAVISGGGGEGILEASKKGYDLFITGEGSHYQYIVAKELKQSVLFGGHYETETIGVTLLAEHIKEKFGVETVFLDEKYEPSIGS